METMGESPKARIIQLTTDSGVAYIDKYQILFSCTIATSRFRIEQG